MTFRIKEQGNRFQVEFLDDVIYDDGAVEYITSKKWIEVGTTQGSLEEAKAVLKIYKSEIERKKSPAKYYDEKGNLIGVSKGEE